MTGLWRTNESDMSHGPSLVNTRTLGICSVQCRIAHSTGYLFLLDPRTARGRTALRGDAVQYLAHTLDAQWVVLPVTQQTPMSASNRTSLQALIALGLPAAPGQLVAGLGWLATLGASDWLVRDRRLSFASAFALAFALLYLGRPVGWTLVDLDLVVCVAVWTTLPRAGRTVLLIGVVALLLLH